MLIGVDRADPSYAEFRDAVRADIAQTPQKVLALRQEIKDLAAPYNALDVVCAAWMSYGLAEPATLRPLVEGGSSATAEYLAHIMLERESPDPEREPTQEERIRGVDLAAISDRVTEIFQRLPLWFSERQSDVADEFDPYLDLRVKFYMQRIAIPSLTYEWDERSTLHGLFDPFDDELHGTLGFTATDALALCESLAVLPRERAQELGAVAREGAAKMKAEVARRRLGKGKEEEQGDVGLEGKLATMAPQDADQWVKHAALAWMGAFLGQAASFAATELAEDAEVETEVAEAFLEVFAADFGNRADAERWRDDPASAIGYEIDTMRRRPILHDGAGSYLPAAVDHVFFGLRDVFTEALKKDSKAWTRYDRHRAGELERRALSALSSALQADWSFGSVKYSFEADTGELLEGEADGIFAATASWC